MILLGRWEIHENFGENHLAGDDLVIPVTIRKKQRLQDSNRGERDDPG